MSDEPGTVGMPSARPVEARAYRDDPGVDPDATPWYRDSDRWLRAGTGAAFVLAATLTHLGPAALAVMVVVAAASTVRARRTGVRWWTLLELAGWVLLVVLAFVLTGIADTLTGVEVAVQLAVGALVGAGVVAAYVAVTRRRAAPAGPPTGV